jgi:orotidine-5'-phosphate decarboxylase
MDIKNPICIALDTPDAERASALLRAVKPHIGFAKIGMEFFYAQGPHGYEAVAREGVPIFLDLKLHDIPNTVAAGLKSLLALTPPPAILNVHASGGLDMMKAAIEAVDGRAKLIAVTILTSLVNQDIWKAGFDHTRDARTHARMLAELTNAAGLDGVVCSPHEVETIKHATRMDFLTVVPGIRPDESETQDQKRVATPKAAIEAGADILVIGRPITGAPDPAQAAQKIFASLHAG